MAKVMTPLLQAESTCMQAESLPHVCKQNPYYIRASRILTKCIQAESLPDLCTIASKKVELLIHFFEPL